MIDHDHVYADGECAACYREAMDDVRRHVLSHRGRWLVVHGGDGEAYRYSSKSEARRHVGAMAEFGERARLIRYRGDRASYSDYNGCLVISSSRWIA